MSPQARANFSCPWCSHAIAIGADMQVGARVRCPRCGADFAATAEDLRAALRAAPPSAPTAERAKPKASVGKPSDPNMKLVQRSAAPAFIWTDIAPEPKASENRPRRHGRNSSLVLTVVAAGLLIVTATAGLVFMIPRPPAPVAVAAPPPAAPAAADSAAPPAPDRHLSSVPKTEENVAPAVASAAAVRLSPIGSVALTAGEIKKIDIHVERNGYQGPIVVTLESATLPEGVSATSATLAADKDAGELELIANLYAPPAQKEARIRAAARDAGVDVTATVALQVVGDPRRAPPPPLTAASVRVSPVGGFTLKPGESKSVEVRVDRRGYVGPFGLEAVDLPPGVSAAPLSFSSDQDAAQFTITAADNAGAAEKEARLRVLNVAENLTSQASFTVAVADASRAEISRWDASGPVGRLAVSPSGDRFLSSAPGGTLQMWDVNTNKEIRSLSTLPKGSGQDVAFAPDGRGALSEIGGDVVLWDAETGKEVRRFERKRAVESVVGSLVYSSDGGSFFAGGMGAFSVWDVKTGQRLHVFEQPGVALGTVLALSPDDSRVLSSYYDHKPELKEPMTAALWDVKTGVKLRMFDIHVCHLTSLAFSPDGSRALSGDCDKMVRLWDLETGKEIRRFLGHTGPVRCVAFSPNGSRALSCGDDKTVRLWDVETGKELWRFEGHTETVRCVVFLSDGRRALSAGDDKTVRLLRLPD